jgi:phage tail-like protein
MTNNKLLQYLPEIYREKGPGTELLERFLGIFAAVLNGIDETIAAVPTYFDPEKAPGDFIPWLAQWFSLDLYELLGERNREFILRAFEFYKEKGTVRGMEKLVTFLTGKKCRVIEFTNNVLRSWGMEHMEGPGVLRGRTNMSKTVDTSDHNLLSGMKTFEDKMFYVNDSGDPGLYAQDVIGLYIFLLKRDREFIINEEQLHKVINSFLPVFVRAEIIIVEENDEVYDLDKIADAFRDRVNGFFKEESRAVNGVYTDTVTWNRFRTYKGTGTPGSFTNDIQFRTFHGDIDVERSMD